MDPLVVLFGLGVGILIGLTGIGGGSLMTPLLILVIGVNPVVAIGTDLAYGAVTKTVGGWRHLRQGTVDLGVSMWLAVGSLPGAVVGALVGAATWWGLTSLDDPRLGPPLVLGIAAALALLAAWFTPGSWTARQGARALVDVLTPTRGFRTLLVVLVLVVVALLVAQTVVLAPAEPSWAPLSGPPFGL